MSVADLLLEAIPFRFPGVVVLLTWVAMFPAGSPVLFAGPGILPACPLLAATAVRAVVLHRAVGPRALPSALAAAEAGVTRRISGIEQLPTFEPLQHR
jgi:hypothetical protein